MGSSWIRMLKIFIVMLLTLNLHAESVKELKKSCDNNNSYSCLELGVYYQLGKVTKKDYSKAKLFYTKSCNLNNVEGCMNLGDLYYLGDGVEQDYSQAKTYYLRACELKDSDSCMYLGDLYLNDTWAEENRSLAKQYYEKSCKLQNKKACSLLAELREEDKSLKSTKIELERLKKEQRILIQEAELLDKL